MKYERVNCAESVLSLCRVMMREANRVVRVMACILVKIFFTVVRVDENPIVD